MKKITTLFSALVLTAFGWQANAQNFDAGACLTGIAIPDNTPAGVDILIPVTGLGAGLGTDIILDQVNFHATHSWGSDLTVTLTSPNGVSVILTNGNGGSGTQYGDDCATLTNFNMSATTAISAGIGNFTGMHIPEEDFASFNDASSPNANWTLNVVDGASGDNGNVEFIELIFVAAPSCIDPNTLTATNITSTSANLGWTQIGSTSVWDIEWSTAGFTPTGTPTTTGVANPTNLTGLTPNTAYEFYVRADCGGGSTSLWTGPYAFSTLPNSVSVPYTQDFEGGSLADFGISTAAESAITLDAGSNCAGNNSLYFTGNTGTGFAGSSTSGTATDAWVTNVSHHAQSILNVDASAVTNSLILTFDLKQEFSYGPTYSWFRVLVNGTQVSADYNPTTTDTDPCATQTIDLTAYIGTTFTLAFQSSMKYNNAEGNSSQGDNAFLDNISITEVTCFAPTALTATNITATSADLGWTNATATTWDIEWSTAGFTPTGTPTITGTTTNPHALTGLTATTAYEFYVRADCGGGDMSAWVGPFSFTTTVSCVAPTALTATNITATSADLGWTNATATTWDIEWSTAGFTPTGTPTITGTTTNPHALTGLTATTAYEFYVRADCGSSDGTSTWTGPFSFTTMCVAPIISAFPYAENFDGETVPSLPCGWTTTDDNNDSEFWGTSTDNPLSGANNLKIGFTGAGVGPHNDWVFTPELQLIGGTSYDLQFAYRSKGTTYVESMTVSLGTARDSLSMTTMLFDSTDFGFTTYDTVMVSFTPPTTASYYVGFFSYSQENQWGILVDDFLLDVSMATAVDDIANNVNLTVSPNPTTGVFTLNVNTTDVNELDIKVMNMQGQVVFAKNNFDNIANVNEQIDLSENANGIYFVTVTTDKGVITHKVVVQ